MTSIQDQIRAAVGQWQGVVVVPHRFGGIEFRYGKRELGHVHGNSLADLPFPMKVRDELIQQGIARPHHILPRSGWVSVPLRGTEDVEKIVGLFRRSWELARMSRPVAGTPAAEEEGQQAKQ